MVHRMWLDDVEVDPEEWVKNHSEFDDLDHYFCGCDPDTALCGADISGLPLDLSDSEPECPCVVCEDLVCVPCAKGCDD